MTFDRSKSRWLLLALVTLVANCGFLRDNRPPDRIYRAEQALKNGSCQLGGTWTGPAGEANYACLHQKVDDVFKAVHGEHPDELSADEVAVLASRFLMPHSDPLTDLEVGGLLSFKALLSGGSNRKLEKVVVHRFIDTIKTLSRLSEWNQTAWYNRERDPGYGQLRDLLEAADHRDAYLESRDVEGWFSLLSRWADSPATRFMRQNLTRQNARAIFGALSLSLGYGVSDGARIPFTTFDRCIAFTKAWSDYKDSSYKRLGPGIGADQKSKVAYMRQMKKEDQAHFDRLTQIILGTGSFHRGVGIDVTELEQFLTQLKTAQFYRPSGRKIVLDYDIANFSRRLLRFKRLLLGGSDAVFDSADLSKLLELYFERTEKMYYLTDLRVTPNQTIPDEYHDLIDRPDYWRFVDRYRPELLRESFFSDRVLERIDLRDAYEAYFTTRLTSAGLLSYGSDAGAKTEARAGLARAEVKDLLYGLAWVERFVETASKDNFLVGAEKTEQFTGGLSTLLDDEQAFNALMLLADSFMPVSKPDGRIDALEMTDLLRTVMSLSTWLGDISTGKEAIGAYELSMARDLKPEIRFEKQDLFEGLLYKDFVHTVDLTMRGLIHWDFYELEGMAILKGWKPEVFQASSPPARRLREWDTASHRQLLESYRSLGLDTDKDGTKTAIMAKIWLTVGSSLHGTKFPQLVSNVDELRALNEKSQYELYWTELEEHAHFGELHFEDVRGYFSQHLKGEALARLSEPLKASLPNVSESFLQDLLSRALWRAPQVAADIRGLRQAGKGIGKFDAFMLLTKLQMPINSEEKLSFDDLQRNLLLLAQVSQDLAVIKAAR